MASFKDLVSARLEMMRSHVVKFAAGRRMTTTNDAGLQKRSSIAVPTSANAFAMERLVS